MTIFGHDHTMSSRQFPPGTMVDKWLKYGGILVDPPNIYQISTTVPAGFIPFCSMISYNSLHLYYKWDHHLFFIIIWWNFNFKSYFLFHSHVIFQHWMIEFRYWCVSVSIKHDDTSTIPKALTEPFKHSSVHVHWTSQHAMWEATMSSCMYVLLMDINWSNVVCMGGA